MTQNYKEEDSLINLPFYSEEIESVTKKSKKKKSNSKIFTKKHKELSNKQLSDMLPLPQKRKKKDLKD